MTNPFGPAAQPQAAPANPFGPAAAPAPQAAPPAFAPPAQQVAPAPEAYGTPGQPGSSQWPAGAQPAAAPTLGTSFSRPAAAASGWSEAKLKDMYGRLVLILPISVRRGVVSNFKDKDGNAQVQDLMTAVFVVLDGGSPIVYGGDPYVMPPIPHTKSGALPHVTRGPVSQSKLVQQCEGALAAVAATGPGSDGAMVLGRLLKNGQELTSAWVLGDYTKTEEEIAAYYLAGVKSGQFVNPLA
jgi:hypothetical protein